ncbi:MAG: rRNA maturation RNase YbeY [Patescibacteria group bacterium]|nr:rRNA maturation RNase YbeY [Patescibacteria group bacterium]
MVIINIIVSKKKFFKLEKLIKQAIKRAINYLKKDNVSISLFLVSNKEMQTINKKSRSKSKATNVLSFTGDKKIPHPELPLKIDYLGEIYLAPDYIKAQKQDIAFLAIHGLLHLLGYTHDGKNDKIKMEQKELEILLKN